jgi:hypothetical protein
LGKSRGVFFFGSELIEREYVLAVSEFQRIVMGNLVVEVGKRYFSEADGVS